MLTTDTEVEETPVVLREPKKKTFNFPAEGFSVEAVNLEEATKKLAEHKSNSK